MKYLDLTLATPEENLACDEALLDWCEAGLGSALLRFWEPNRYFVVLGYANHARREIDLQACRLSRIPILRRCSGGGTVVQGPGCLNYALVLKIDGVFQSITETNRFIMQRHQEALSTRLGQPIAVEGFSDLALRGLKFSGNAQRRRRHWLLFHGTFLLDFDLGLIDRLLLLPSKQPAYRRNRSHSDFLTQLGLPSPSIKAALRTAWDAAQPLEEIPEPAIKQLVGTKYAKTEWNLRG
jgi:lipoate---protein ligase